MSTKWAMYFIYNTAKRNQERMSATPAMYFLYNTAKINKETECQQHGACTFSTARQGKTKNAYTVDHNNIMLSLIQQSEVIRR